MDEHLESLRRRFQARSQQQKPVESVDDFFAEPILRKPQGLEKIWLERLDNDDTETFVTTKFGGDYGRALELANAIAPLLGKAALGFHDISGTTSTDMDGLEYYLGEKPNIQKTGVKRYGEVAFSGLNIGNELARATDRVDDAKRKLKDGGKDLKACNIMLMNSHQLGVVARLAEGIVPRMGATYHLSSADSETGIIIWTEVHPGFDSNKES